MGIGRGKNDSDVAQNEAEDDLSLMVTTGETTVATETHEMLPIVTEASNAVPASLYDIVTPEDSQRNVLIIHHSEDDGDDPDTYMLLTYHRESWTLSISSILKDCYVSVPEYMGYHLGNTKLEYVYALGNSLNGEQGGKYMIQACLKENFNIDVDEIVLTEDLALQTFVDELDGVDVWVSMEDIDKITLMLMGNEEVTLDGESAVRYVGFDKYQSNTHRAECQRNLLISIIEKCKKTPIAELMEVINATYPCLNTNLSSEEIARYILEMSHFKIEEATYPAEGTYWGEIVDTTGNGTLESVLRFGNMNNPSTPETTAPAAEDIVLELQKEDITIAAGLGIRLMLKNNVDPTTVTWRAKDEDIVSVDERGEIKALKAGTTRVYVEYGNQTDSVIVRVIES